MKAWEWIDRAKEHNGWDSDYRAAKELSVTRAAISGYRNREGSTLDEDVAVKVAEALGLRPAVVMFDQMRERSKNPKARDAFEDAIKAAGGKAAGILIAAALGVGVLASPGNARAAATNSVAPQSGSLYIV